MVDGLTPRRYFIGARRRQLAISTWRAAHMAVFFQATAAMNIPGALGFIL